MLMHAVARLALHPVLTNIQVCCLALRCRCLLHGPGGKALMHAHVRLKQTTVTMAFADVHLSRVRMNLQASWVKMGPERAAQLLSVGCNDMGGSIMQESITKAAGEHLLVCSIPSLIAGVTG
jgi:2-iminoacetate synthase ThiH